MNICPPWQSNRAVRGHSRHVQQPVCAVRDDLRHHEPPVCAVGDRLLLGSEREEQVKEPPELTEQEFIVKDSQEA